MLSAETMNKCRLKIEGNNFAVSVIWQMKCDGEMSAEPRICRTVFRLSQSLTLTEAGKLLQAHMTDLTRNPMNLPVLNSIACALRGIRIRNGY